MNRKQFQEWLDQFPEDTIIQVGIQDDAPDWESWGSVEWREFKGDSSEDYEFFDFTNNQFVKPIDNHYKKRYLELGQSN